MIQIEVEAGRTLVENYEFSENRDLEKVIIPDSVERIGKHAFYNCRNLRSVEIPGHLFQIEDGAFKNCGKLKYVKIISKDGQTACMKNIVADMTHEIEFEIEYPDGTAKVLVPGYNYDYEIDINSRVFHEVVYGSGDAYQRCVGKAKLDYSEYDFLFAVAKREELEQTVFHLVENRLKYPYQLEEDAKEKYIKYLKDHVDLYLKGIITNNDQQGLRLAADCELFQQEKMEEYLDLAAREKNIECTAFLLEYQNQHFSLFDQEFEF